MKFSIGVFSSNISLGSVYYFKSEKINSPEPHYFIVTSIIRPSIIHFTCCTTKFQKRVDYYNRNNIPYTCLVPIDKDDDNGLKELSFVDCNNYISYTFDKFCSMYDDDEIIGGPWTVSENHFQQILSGIKNSTLLDPEEINFLLNPVT